VRTERLRDELSPELLITGALRIERLTEGPLSDDPLIARARFDDWPLEDIALDDMAREELPLEELPDEIRDEPPDELRDEPPLFDELADWLRPPPLSLSRASVSTVASDMAMRALSATLNHVCFLINMMFVPPAHGHHIPVCHERLMDPEFASTKRLLGTSRWSKTSATPSVRVYMRFVL
jgi:hypothetical protein